MDVDRPFRALHHARPFKPTITGVGYLGHIELFVPRKHVHGTDMVTVTTPDTLAVIDLDRQPNAHSTFLL